SLLRFGGRRATAWRSLDAGRDGHESVWWRAPAPGHCSGGSGAPQAVALGRSHLLPRRAARAARHGQYRQAGRDGHFRGPPARRRRLRGARVCRRSRRRPRSAPRAPALVGPAGGRMAADVSAGRLVSEEHSPRRLSFARAGSFKRRMLRLVLAEHRAVRWITTVAVLESLIGM